MSWLDPVSDVNDSKVSVMVACPGCGKQAREDVSVETLANMTRQNDGSYVDEAECYDCLAKA